MKNKKFRHELKYLINEMEKDIIMLRIGDVLKLDKHTTNGMYMIRSLYFDDMWDTALEEKIAGTATRKKYRIRIYDCKDTIIKLECKIKQGQYIHKESASLSREETERLIAGDYRFLIQRNESLCHNFYYECMTNQMRPKVIVDYERIPFVYEPGDVRVTFDLHVRAGMLGYQIFDPYLPTVETLEPGELVMEVKYTEFLPSIIKEILPPDNSKLTAVSKYVLCREKRMELAGV